MFVAGYHLYWQTEDVDIADPDDCSHKFRSNVEFAFLVFVAILVGRI
jgi:4-hydroxybenzoate polyprenyltransferase